MKQKHRKTTKFKHASTPAEQEVSTEMAPLPGAQKSQSIWYTTPLGALMLISLLGFATFWTGLRNHFYGDDWLQIVSNPIVHSLSNLPTFFQGSTFYVEPNQPLIGAYYRPVMLTVFSLLYTLFGPHPFAFHLLQLILHVLGAFMLFLVFRYFFKPALALVLALVFLVHPINSQAVYLIAAIQEPLFFLFGILAIWTLLRFQKPKYLFLTSALFLLSMLSKETGILFAGVAIIYLFIFDRKRINRLILILIPTVATYAFLWTHALRHISNPHTAPIDELSLAGRLINVPSMILLYLQKFLFPLHLAVGYYWAYTTVTFQDFFFPLLITFAIAGLTVSLAIVLRKRRLYRHFGLFIFFLSWFTLGMLIHLQITPLDMTASETWFYFPMVGLLGMIGTIVDGLLPRLNRQWNITIVVCLLIVLSARTAVRGFDWHDNYTLAKVEINYSKSDYNAERYIADHLGSNGKFAEAKAHAELALKLYVTPDNLDALGSSQAAIGDYAGAQATFRRSLQLSDVETTYQDLVHLTLYYGYEKEDRQFLAQAIQKFPDYGYTWYVQAIWDQTSGDNIDAKRDISQAVAHGYGASNDPYTFSHINNNEPIQLNTYPSSWFSGWRE